MNQNIVRTKQNRRYLRWYLWLSVIIPGIVVGLSVINGNAFLSDTHSMLLFAMLFLTFHFGILYVPAVFPTDQKKAKRIVYTFVANIAVVVLFGSLNLYSLYTLFLLYGLTNITANLGFLVFLGIRSTIFHAKKKDLKATLGVFVFGAVSFLLMLIPAWAMVKLIIRDAVQLTASDYAFIVYAFSGIAFSAVELIKDLTEEK